MCKPVVSLDGHALFTHASRAYDAPSGRVLNYHAYTFLFRMGTYNCRQIRRCDVTGLVLCAAPELHNKNPYAWTKSRMKCFGFVPRQYSTVHTVQTDMRPLVVLFDLMCIAPGGGIPSTLDTYCRRDWRTFQASTVNVLESACVRDRGQRGGMSTGRR